MNDGKKTILITGAAGNIGTVLRRGLRDRYTIRALCHSTIPEQEGEESIVVGDICDFEVMLEVTQGVDAVVHMAIGTSKRGWTRARYHQEMLEANNMGTYNIYETARLNNVKTVVFASTNHVTGFYEREGIYTTPDMPVRPDGLYGATKAFGEALGRYYSDGYGMSVFCLRIGSIGPKDEPYPGVRCLSSWISHRDMVQLVWRCIEAPEGVKFGIFYGISDNTRKYWDISNARELVNYQPEDDAERFISKLGIKV